ncbi:MAG TPA: DMT family transporter [Candidatus Dormibacteraeota bacterium]|nr:DMT family transporter [Candidatus Dormibacteraeota bacterium]
MARRDVASFVTLAGIWGSSFLLIRLGDDDLPPFAVAEIRLALGALAAWCLARALGVGGIGGALRRPIVALTGLCASGVPFVLFAYGETRVASGIAGIGNATTPLFAAVIAQAVPLRLGGERMTRQRAIGLAIGFGGVVALVGDSAFGKLDAIGLACCVAAPVLYGVGGVLARSAYRDDDPIVAAVAGNALAALCLLPFAAIFGVPDHRPGAGSLAAVAVLGVVGTGIAFVLFYRLLASIGSVTFTLTFLVPAFAVAEGAIFLGETIRPASILALAAILAGVAVATGLLPWRTRRRRTSSESASRTASEGAAAAIPAASPAPPPLAEACVAPVTRAD